MAYHRILTIQDISCVGQCSMTVALPVLSACGHETCILPTAVLSAHTAFRDPVIRQLADTMDAAAEHWKRENIRFDAIYVGYLGSISAIHSTERILSEMLAPGGITLVDPAMADHGRLYSGFDEAYAREMGALCRKADYILPNITEAAMFTGLPWKEQLTESYVQDLMDGLDHPGTILTGVGYSEDRTGIQIRQGNQYYSHPRFPRSFHGTGDLFASCFTGALLRGMSLYDSVKLAGDMVCLSIGNTMDSPEHWYGVKFETMLPELIRRLNAQ